MLANDSQEGDRTERTNMPNQLNSSVRFPQIDTRRLLQSSANNSFEMPQSVRSDNVSLTSIQKSLDHG